MKQKKEKKPRKGLFSRRKKAEKTPRYTSIRPEGKSRHSIRARHRKNALTTAAMVTVLFAIIIYVSLKVLFVVKKVEVTGTEKYTADDITSFCRIPYDENIFKVDTESYETRLYDEFVYIDSVTVTRKYPYKISVVITDSVPTYYTKDGDSYIIWSQSFKKLTTQARQPDSLTGVSGDFTDETLKQTLDEIIRALQAGGYSDRVTYITVSSVTDTRVTADGRIDIKIGTVNDIDYKLQMAFHVIENELGADERGTIDITDTSKAVFNAAG